MKCRLAKSLCQIFPGPPTNLHTQISNSDGVVCSKYSCYAPVSDVIRSSELLCHVQSLIVVYTTHTWICSVLKTKTLWLHLLPQLLILRICALKIPFPLIRSKSVPFCRSSSSLSSSSTADRLTGNCLLCSAGNSYTWLCWWCVSQFVAKLSCINWCAK